jgi:hypothetical protein
MSEQKESVALSMAKQLPYKKWWFWVLVVIILRVMNLAYNDSRPVVYDPLALGFTSEEAMNAAFAKGYHTRQKMEEMARFYDEASPSTSTASPKR